MSKREDLGSVAPKGYKNVKKRDIISKVAKKSATSKVKVSQVIDSYWAVVKDTIKTDPKSNINIPNVGSIKTVKKSARTYSVKGLKNTSKKTVKVGAKNVVKFTVSDNFLKTEKSKSKRKSTTSGKKKIG